MMVFDPEQICNPTLDFNQKCLEIFEWQLKNNQLYKKYVTELESLELFNTGSDPKIDSIPLMPIEVFRDVKVTLLRKDSEAVFKSSGTTGMVRSEHHVPYVDIYKKAIWEGLNFFYPIDEFVFLGYTPGYDQNPNSSLVWMINYMISQDKTGLSRFLPIGEPVSIELINQISSSNKRIMLFGAAFGLIELVEKFPNQLPPDSIVMETGGMKTFRKEMSRDAMHQQLALGFGLPLSQVHSEYGMTELLSQGYSRGSEWFDTPPWMKVTIRNPENPSELMPIGQQGLIGIIDLANWATLPFLLTGDRGVQRKDGSFKVLGRWNSYFLRGCNFLLESDS